MKTNSQKSSALENESLLTLLSKPVNLDPQKLIDAAVRAREGAVAPYSKFKVGAALLTRAGVIIGGANVESASYGLTCCAERVALFHALTSGKKNFIAIAVVARIDNGPMPCGACRQLLAEYAPQAKVFVADTANLKKISAFAIKQLLPAAFVGGDWQT
jgi:cytidine deaminase